MRALALAAALASLLTAGVARGEDHQAALQRCKAKFEPACLDRARAIRRARKRKHRAVARALFLLACDKKNEPSACDDLGVMRSKGSGGRRDPAGARQAHARACTLGLANGCHNLGAVTYHGRGTRRDLKAARALFSKACAGGVAAACGNLGLMVYRGEGGPAKQREALPLLDKGCKGGARAACRALKTPELRGHRALGKKTLYRAVVITGACGVSRRAIFKLLSKAEPGLRPCLPAGRLVKIRATVTGGKTRAARITPGGKTRRCVKGVFAKIKWGGDKRRCQLSLQLKAHR